MQTGSYATSFARRSPLTALKSLQERLGQKDLGPDYDLAEQQFLTYVPEDYDQGGEHDCDQPGGKNRSFVFLLQVKR